MTAMIALQCFLAGGAGGAVAICIFAITSSLRQGKE